VGSCSKLLVQVVHAALVLAALVALPASAARYSVYVYDYVGCVADHGCFYPNPITIRAGDSIGFGVDCEFGYCDRPGAYRHNVVADDGSFRCARGCDDDGGDGTPVVLDQMWGFVRAFNTPGLVRYHDEVSGASGLIVVLGGPDSRVVEYFNPDLGTYFITSDVGEQAYIDVGGAGNWRRTGETFKSGGPAKVCRFVGNPYPYEHPRGPNSHFYTANADECRSLKFSFNVFVPSWKFESEDFTTTAADAFGCPTPLTPIYRAYNNGFLRGIDSNHRITPNFAAYQSMLERGWIGEGIVMCAPH
jgi:hypothetical protein